MAREARVLETQTEILSVSGVSAAWSRHWAEGGNLRCVTDRVGWKAAGSGMAF